jgi:hypothetical protein
MPPPSMPPPVILASHLRQRDACFAQMHTSTSGGASAVAATAAMKKRTAGVTAAMVSTGTIRVSLSSESDGCHSGTDTQSKGSQSASSSSDTSEADYRPTADKAKRARCSLRNHEVVAADAAIPKSSSLESETRKVQLFLDNADLDRSRGERRVQPLNRPRPPPPVPQRRVQQERQPAQPRHERRQWNPHEVRNRRSSSSVL